jgi:hypothetical protein
MITKKDRKNSGKYTPELIKPRDMKFKEIIDEALEPNEEYDDWLNYRDGFRDKKGRSRKEKEIKKFPYKKGGRNRCQRKY